MLLHTKAELDQIHKEKLTELVDHAGSWYYLARMLGISPSVPQKWVDQGQISKKGAELVEKHPTLGEKFKASDLRLDLNFWS